MNKYNIKIRKSEQSSIIIHSLLLGVQEVASSSPVTPTSENACGSSVLGVSRFINDSVKKHFVTHLCPTRRIFARHPQKRYICKTTEALFCWLLILYEFSLFLLFAPAWTYGARLAILIAFLLLGFSAAMTGIKLMKGYLAKTKI